MTDLLMIKRTTFKLCKNSRKNFLDEMTDLLMMKRTRFKCIKRGIRTSWTRWQIYGLIYDDEENWILQCAKINMKDLGACLWGFDFVDVWNVIFFLFFWSCFFPFPLVWWQNNWSVDRGRSLKIQLWDRVKRVFVGWQSGQERNSKPDENKIQNVMREQDSKMCKTNHKKSGTIWQTAWWSQGANL